MANPQIQASDIKAVRADAILTTDYVAGTVIDDCEYCNQLMVFFKFTKGSLTSLEIKIEFSHDGITYYQEISEAISSGIATMSEEYHQLTPSGNQNGVLSIPIKCSKIKISAKGTGTVTGSSLKIDAIIGVA